MLGVRHHPIIWFAAIAAGGSYFGAVLAGLSGPAVIAWKGAGVALLALWAARQANSRAGWAIAAVMAFGALGDVLLDSVSLLAGAVAFSVGHLIAIALYLLHRRPSLSPTQRIFACIIVPFALVIAASITRGHPMALAALAYTGGVATMVAAAWTSRFPRYRTGMGAVMFLISDLLIFARQGVLADSALPGLLIWPLYFGGQALIVHGVVTTLVQDRRAADV